MIFFPTSINTAFNVRFGILNAFFTNLTNFGWGAEPRIRQNYFHLLALEHSKVFDMILDNLLLFLNEMTLKIELLSHLVLLNLELVLLLCQLILGSGCFLLLLENFILELLLKLFDFFLLFFLLFRSLLNLWVKLRVLVEVLKRLVNNLRGWKAFRELLRRLQELDLLFFMAVELVMLVFVLDGNWKILMMQLLSARVPLLKILVLNVIRNTDNVVLIEALIGLRESLIMLSVLIGHFNAQFLI